MRHANLAELPELRHDGASLMELGFGELNFPRQIVQMTDHHRHDFPKARVGRMRQIVEQCARDVLLVPMIIAVSVFDPHPTAYAVRQPPPPPPADQGNSFLYRTRKSAP
jgi:hypothetical protein